MTEFRGKPVFSGIAIGKIAILKKDDQRLLDNLRLCMKKR